MTNIAMGNGLFIDGLPSYKMVDLSMAMLNNQMVDTSLMAFNGIYHDSWW